MQVGQPRDQVPLLPNTADNLHPVDLNSGGPERLQDVLRVRDFSYVQRNVVDREPEVQDLLRSARITDQPVPQRHLPKHELPICQAHQYPVAVQPRSAAGTPDLLTGTGPHPCN